MVEDGGNVTPQGYFQPYDYQNMDRSDENFGKAVLSNKVVHSAYA
jgi:hypothetical protein